ncbi:T9SS type A sorting domain-containing protein [Chryseobacterium kwangjuense]|uniref:T9SS type A sorting domain-containing protein n=1 Tax=Chryseobacterium kwangjuense TaxID=267125 RepID=A0ABW9JY34_9FLAO
MRKKYISLSLAVSLANVFNGQCLKTVSTQFESVAAINSDGNIWVWGSNHYGELGTGDYVNRATPFQLTTSGDWKSVSHTYMSTLALKNDGTRWGWGDAQLGNGSTFPVLLPVQIGTDHWKVLYTGLFTSYGVKVDGTLWVWGTGIEGQFGNGTMPVDPSLIPIQVGPDTDWKFLAVSSHHTLGLKNNGTLWSWGNNAVGQLGIGSSVSKFSTPQQVGTESNWKTVSAKGFHSLALKSDGSLWGWGMNEHGELGDGTAVQRNSPVQIGNSYDWKSITTTTRYRSFAIKNDGSLWGWGQNENGELGDGTTIQRNSPVQIGNSYDWKSIDCGALHCVAIKQDNSVWSWGGNFSGELGNGTITGTYTQAPSMILGSCSFLGNAENESFSTKKVKIYPNPVSENIYFSKEIKSIKIYSGAGALVKYFSDLNSNSIDISALQPGTYMIDAFTVDGNNLQEKIIKK